MPWIIAFVVIAVFIATGVTGVAHPVLYGLFIAAVVVLPLWVVWDLVGGVIDSLFGRRK